jgi:uncharacterized protein
MLNIGKKSRLEVKRLTAIGAYLDSDEGDILLPNKYLSEKVTPGAQVDVFVYFDSEDRIVATTERPKAEVGAFALMEVKDVGSVGAFLDWGLEKDLLLPFSEQLHPMKKGETALVRVYLDRSGRIAASAKVAKFLERVPSSLKVGQEVRLIFYEFSDLGAKVIINDLYQGLLFKNELFGKFQVGSTASGFVKKIREDGKVDVTLRKGGQQDVSGGKETFLRVLGERGGFLPVGDKSSPELIYELFGISKKNFKTVIGNLYKAGIIEISKDGVRMR